MSSNCVTGKRRFASEDLAVEALIQNHIVNEYSTYQGPRDVYQCVECGEWHFTSQGNNAILKDPKIQARIKKERLGNHWERRFKK